MQKIKYLASIYYTVLFFCSKRCQIKFNLHYYLIMKIGNIKELQNIATAHSGDIDYKDFMKIYSECKKEIYYFLKIHITLAANDPLRFRKNLFHSYKNDSN